MIPSSTLKTALLLLLLPFSARAQAATITWNVTHQTIDGFGVSNHQEGIKLTTAQADLIFSTTAGNGYSILRIGTPEDGSCGSVSAACANGGDPVSDMLLAEARGAKIFATSWTPPPSMKTNGSISCTGGASYGSLLPASYGAFAIYLSNYIKSLNAYYGLNIYAISPQNEPEGCHPYDSALWSGADLDAFIKNNLGPTLAANGQTSVKIMMPEPGGWEFFSSYNDSCMTDSRCASYVGINSFHGYDNSFSISNPYASQQKGFWQTEASAGSGYGPSTCGGCWDPSIADAMMWAKIIDYNIAVGNENAWLYWSIKIHNGIDNEAVLGPGGFPSIRTYVIGQYSRFVRPGWVRIDATHTPVSGVLISAYKNSSTGDFAIVATNQNDSSVSQQFNLSLFSATTVTPWVTSASLNLAQQSNVTAGSSFTYRLPAQSVTTFVGSNGTAPSPPSTLRASVY